MSLRPFHLFYLLTIVLLALGYLTSGAEQVEPGWHTVIVTGMWSFFIPAAVCSLLTALIYHYLSRSGRKMQSGLVILHFVLVSLGLLFSINFYRLVRILVSEGVPDTTAIGSDTFLYVLAGPILLLASLVVFIVGLAGSKQATA